MAKSAMQKRVEKATGASKESPSGRKAREKRTREHKNAYRKKSNGGQGG